jgi:hypothetical protein
MSKQMHAWVLLRCAHSRTQTHCLHVTYPHTTCSLSSPSLPCLIAGPV